MIPLCDLQIQYANHADELQRVVAEVMAAGHYILGPNVNALEEEIAEYLGCKHAIAVNSGTDALHLALRALNIGPGDEVITTPFTFVATTEAIGLVGATPVFVDIDPHTYNMDANAIERVVTSNTKAILPVHLYGQPCDMATIGQLADRYDLAVVEDCAQAFGAKYNGQSVGTLGTVGCLSFFPSKNLGCFGDGGMIVTNSDEVFERSEMLRRHGGKIKYHHSELGLNSRLDEIQAAILRVKLKHISEWNEARRRIAAAYTAALRGFPEIRCPSDLTESGKASTADVPLECVFHQYTVQVSQRADVQEHLTRDGIGSAVYYPIPLHLQAVHANLGYQKGAFPHAEFAADHCLSLPMFPELTNEQAGLVVDSLAQVLATPANQRIA
ncbi:DegT/DnrJ/EryC1/StrS family aminotransferase [Roseimaritima ulvae]|uniref:UDP-2-acetamido-2-deoxy-3-oxo-D-glucuronate aminotransferase n=1 Tax=Roseimaritima ulvae TaxID=980254 RepID=A0A5B9QVD1_9BACT|nr:DegT/DnrJ/EryC1/StrS family aminotransferase [Roseimaritima ulvae]QEG42994.1 UDP-2-acetamido-2-deoxy-3-oxo-D-glucuronate aminotransferase [Roseimaritima ulvae]